MRHAKSFDKYPPAELKEVSRRAGLASGKARREKRKRLEQMKLEDQAHREALRTEVELLRTAARELKRAARMQEGKGML